MNLNWITIAKIICRKYQFRSIFLIQLNVFDDDIYYAKKCLIKSFDDFVLFEVFRNNRLSKYVLICVIIIEIIIFIIFIIINAKTINFKIVFLIASLIAFQDKKKKIIFNNLHFRAFISIIKKGHKIFVVIMITRCYEIINIEINQIPKFFFKTNMSLIKCLTCLFDNV